MMAKAHVPRKEVRDDGTAFQASWRRRTARNKLAALVHQRNPKTSTEPAALASSSVAPIILKNDASKEVTTSKDVPAKLDLGFHPRTMDRAVSGLHGNAPKEENDTLKRRRFWLRLGRAKSSSGDRRTPPP
jgi:hypothetical protein